MASHKVKVGIPKREQWPTYWLLQKEYSPGVYDLEVDDQQLQELKSDPVALLAEIDGVSTSANGEPMPVAAASTASTKPVATKGAR